MSDVLLVFLKPPRPSEVKTRLAALLGADDAAGLYRAVAGHVMRRTRSGRYRRLAFFTPADARAEMEAWLPGETWHAQRGADLGERMSDAFETAFAAGARRAVIVGSDLPWLDSEAVEQALDALASADLVLGPAEDGGYYLMGLARPEPRLFDAIPWSSEAVLDRTLERASQLGLRTHRLETRRDLDTTDDVRALWPDLEALLDPALRARIARALREADRGER